MIDWNTIPENDKQEKKEAKKKNPLAIYHVQSTLDKSSFPWIVDAKSIKDASKALKEAYQDSDQVKVVKLQTLKNDFKNLRIKECQWGLC